MSYMNVKNHVAIAVAIGILVGAVHATAARPAHYPPLWVCQWARNYTVRTRLQSSCLN